MANELELELADSVNLFSIAVSRDSCFFIFFVMCVIILLVFFNSDKI